MSDTDLVTPYREYFQILFATTEELRQRAYALRYQVYCSELGWEDPANFPNGLEKDEFDDASLHCILVHRPSGTDAGTVRLVTTQPTSPEPCLPLLAHYDRQLFDSEQSPLKIPKGTYGEISRLALTERFRRRPGERDTPDGGPDVFQWSQTERRRFPHIALGLYLAAATVGLSQGLNAVYAMMEPRLARHLHFGGIFFNQVGQAIEFRGQRAPFYLSRAMLFQHLGSPLRALLDAIAEDLGVELAER
ncbi:N-acyl amino acid synthase, PEP-CTERM/exosortase system-associated [Thiorhodovibrio winogradskyi]|uniref:N-acyl amino acid synthase, PEP-CTERM/exosortase system-associated n=1 Tax=Thiorhodovibrio winogradskyi TaxID=77007 RepID=A0ABZ0S9E0_9GAMM|nr:PEP-CTERM/exosortase system-associated acyltransferase [Thiorhodovibrio winogradskyi]